MAGSSIAVSIAYLIQTRKRGLTQRHMGHIIPITGMTVLLLGMAAATQIERWHVPYVTWRLVILTVALGLGLHAIRRLRNDKRSW